MTAEERTTSSTGGQKGVKLARFDLIPAGPLQRLAEHFGKGAQKYSEHQWRNGYEWSKSYSAIQRHLNDFWAGKDYDVCANDPTGCAFKTETGEVVTYNAEQLFVIYEPNGRVIFQFEDLAGRKINYNAERDYEPNTCYNHTGSHHMDAVMWHSFVLREFVETHPDHDDRYKNDGSLS